MTPFGVWLSIALAAAALLNWLKIPRGRLSVSVLKVSKASAVYLRLYLPAVSREVHSKKSAGSAHTTEAYKVLFC